MTPASDRLRRQRVSVKPPASFKNPNLVPNWTLAQDILDSGDRDTVVSFLESSRALWTSDQGRLDHMLNFVKRASSPDLQQLFGQMPGAEIRFTLDGTVPEGSDSRYDKPIRLTGPAIVRARAFKDGFTRSIAAQQVLIIGK